MQCNKALTLELFEETWDTFDEERATEAALNKNVEELLITLHSYHQAIGFHAQLEKEQGFTMDTPHHARLRDSLLFPLLEQVFFVRFVDLDNPQDSSRAVKCMGAEVAVRAATWALKMVIAHLESSKKLHADGVLHTLAARCRNRSSILVAGPPTMGVAPTAAFSKANLSIRTLRMFAALSEVRHWKRIVAGPPVVAGSTVSVGRPPVIAGPTAGRTITAPAARGRSYAAVAAPVTVAAPATVARTPAVVAQPPAVIARPPIPTAPVAGPTSSSRVPRLTAGPSREQARLLAAPETTNFQPSKKARVDGPPIVGSRGITNYGALKTPKAPKLSAGGNPPSIANTAVSSSSVTIEEVEVLGVSDKVREGVSRYLLQDMPKKKPLRQFHDLIELQGKEGIYHLIRDEKTGGSHLVSATPTSVNNETEALRCFERYLQSSEYPNGGTIYEPFAIVLRNLAERVFWSCYSMTPTFIEKFFGGDLVRPFFAARLEGHHTMIHFTMSMSMSYLVPYLIAVDKHHQDLNKADPRYDAETYDHSPFFTWDFLLPPGAIATRHDKSFYCSIRGEQIIIIINTSANLSTVGMGLTRLEDGVNWKKKISDEVAQIECWPADSNELKKILAIVTATLAQKSLSGSVVTCTPDHLKFDPVATAERQTNNRFYRHRVVTSSARINARHDAQVGSKPIPPTHVISAELTAEMASLSSQLGLLPDVRKSLKFPKVLPAPLESPDVIAARARYAAVLPAIGRLGVAICLCCLKTKCRPTGVREDTRAATEAMSADSRALSRRFFHSKSDQQPGCRDAMALGTSFVFVPDVEPGDIEVQRVLASLKASSTLINGIVHHHLLYVWYAGLTCVLSGSELFTHIHAFLELPEYANHPQLDYLKYRLTVPKSRGAVLMNLLGRAYTKENSVGGFEAGGKVDPQKWDFVHTKIVDPSGYKAAKVAHDLEVAACAARGAPPPPPVKVSSDPDEEEEEEEAEEEDGNESQGDDEE